MRQDLDVRAGATQVQAPSGGRLMRLWAWTAFVLCLLPASLNVLGFSFSTNSGPPGLALPSGPAVELSPAAQWAAHAGRSLHELPHWLVLILGAAGLVLSCLYRRISGDRLSCSFGLILFVAGLVQLTSLSALPAPTPGVAVREADAAFLESAIRIVMSLVIVGGAWLTLRRGPLWGPRARVIALTSASLAGVAIAAITLRVGRGDPLPTGLLPGGLVVRPFDLVPVVVYVAGAGWFLRLLRRRLGTNYAQAALVSLLPLVVAQLHLALGSFAPLDNHYMAAHFLFVFGFSLPLVGFAADVLGAYQEQTLREERHFLRLILDTVPNLIFTRDAASRYLVVNQATAAFFGRRPEDLVGRSVGTLLSDPTTAAVVMAEDRRVIENMQPMVIEQTIPNADGEPRILQVIRTPIIAASGQSVEILGVGTDITDVKRAEEALRESEEHHREVVENQGEGLGIVDANDRFTFANPAAEEIFGVPRGTLTGRHLSDFVPTSWWSVVQEQMDSRRQGSRSSYELEIERAGSGRRTLLVTATPRIDSRGAFLGTLAIFRDITERKATEEALRASEQQTRQILDQAHDAFVATDTEGRVVEWNSQAERTFGWTRDEIVGRDIHETIVPQAHREAHRRRLHEFAARGGELRIDRKVEATVLHRDGREFPVEMALWAVWSGDRCLFNAFVRDLSERHEAERTKDVMEVQLRQAQKMEAIGQLAAGIAHEINTPTQYVGDNLRFLEDAFRDLLLVLSTYAKVAEAARTGGVPTELLAELDTKIQEAELDYLNSEIPLAITQGLDGVSRVATIVRAMKEFSHPGTNKKTPLDINRAIETTTVVSRNAWKYVADLETDFDSNLPPVPCLPGEFNQVMLNVVVNAAQAIAEAVGEGTGERGKITITTRGAGEWAEIRVSDTGSGIPEAVRQRIFEPFFTTKEVGKGTGQGLAMAHSVIVNRHGGELTFESEVGRGTTFIIRLPLDTPGEELPQDEREDAHLVRG